MVPYTTIRSCDLAHSRLIMAVLQCEQYFCVYSIVILLVMLYCNTANIFVLDLLPYCNVASWQYVCKEFIPLPYAHPDIC